MTVIKKLIW